MGFLGASGGGSNGMMLPGFGSSGNGGNGGFNGTSFIGDQGGVNLSGLPFVGGLFPNAAQQMQRQMMANAANTLGAMQPGIAQGFQNIFNGTQQAYGPAQRALAMMYGGAPASAPSGDMGSLAGKFAAGGAAPSGGGGQSPGSALSQANGMLGIGGGGGGGGFMGSLTGLLGATPLGGGGPLGGLMGGGGGGLGGILGGLGGGGGGPLGGLLGGL